MDWMEYQNLTSRYPRPDLASLAVPNVQLLLPASAYLAH